MGELGTAGCHARVLVPGLPIYRCRQRNGQRLLSRGDIRGAWQYQRLSKRRGQRQPNASAILSDVWDPAFQRGGSAASSDLRARRHVRGSGSGESCGDDLDVVCAALGLHQRRIAASGKATTSSGITRHPSRGLWMVQTNRGYMQPYSERSVRHEALESRLHSIRRLRGSDAKSEGRVHDEKRHE